MNRDFLFKDEGAFVADVIKFFFAKLFGKEHFDKVLEVCLKNPEVVQSIRQVHIKNGSFSLNDFFYYLITTNPQGGVLKNVIIEELVRRFCTWNLLIRSDLLLSYGIDYYQVNEPLAKYLLDRDALENLAFDFPYLVEKYRSSVLHFVIRDKEGDQWNATGFLFASNNLVLTNNHVIDEDENHTPRLLTAEDKELAWRCIERSTYCDLALLQLAEPLDTRPLFPSLEVGILDDVVTMGFPRIPLSTTAPMIAHKGEINGHMILALGERLIFSAKTNPGNSGGPLINRAGLVVGVVTEDLQTQQGAEQKKPPYFSAIPINLFVPAFKHLLVATNKNVGELTSPQTSGTTLKNGHVHTLM